MFDLFNTKTSKHLMSLHFKVFTNFISDYMLFCDFILMQITQPEVKAIVVAFVNPEALRTSGVYLGGIKYMYLQSDEAQIQAKKGSAGVAIAKSNKCMFHSQH